MTDIWEYLKQPIDPASYKKPREEDCNPLTEDQYWEMMEEHVYSEQRTCAAHGDKLFKPSFRQLSDFEERQLQALSLSIVGENND